MPDKRISIEPHMFKFTTSRSLQTVVLILIVIGLIVMALGGYLSPLSRIVLNPLISAQAWLSNRYQAIQEFYTVPSDLVRLRQRNGELEAEVARLQSQVIDLQGQISEVDVLTTLLDFRRAHPENEYVSASVIGRDTSPFLHYVIINRGSDDGLRRGMPVVTNQGLVGRIDAVLPNAARLQLITDTDSRINIRLKQSNADAVLVGQVTGDVSLEMIPQDIKVEAGDLVLTSGLGGDYPPNLLIGQVTGVRRHEAELFQTASVQPVVDFTQLQIVLVITNFQPVEISPLISTPSAP
jgi:rod shape-determining protein MreC